MRKHLATNEEKDIFRFQFGYPGYRLTLDHRSKRLYTHKYRWWDSNNDIISMDYDGNDRKQMIKFDLFYYNSSLDVTGNVLYLTTPYSTSIIKVNASTEEIFRYIPLPKDFMVRKLLVVGKNRQPKGMFILLWRMVGQIVV